MEDGHSCPSDGQKTRSKQRLLCNDSRSTMRQFLAKTSDMNVQATGIAAELENLPQGARKERASGGKLALFRREGDVLFVGSIKPLCVVRRLFRRSCV